MSFTKFSIFVLTIVHEEVVDLVEVVRLLDEHDKFLLFETRSLHSKVECFFCHNRPGTRVSNLCSTISKILLFLSFQKNPDLLIF